VDLVARVMMRARERVALFARVTKRARKRVMKRATEVLLRGDDNDDRVTGYC
jgi:hypothetical protein